MEPAFVPVFRAPVPDATFPGLPAAMIGPDPFMNSFWKRISVNVAAWTVAGFFFASQLYFLYPIASGQAMPFSRALLINLPFYYLWALVTPAILSLARRFPIERARWRKPLAIHLVASTVLSAVQLFLAGASSTPSASRRRSRSSSG